jgi:hypothetical protein
MQVANPKGRHILHWQADNHVAVVETGLQQAHVSHGVPLTILLTGCHQSNEPQGPQGLEAAGAVPA